MDPKKKSLKDKIGYSLLSVRTRYALMTAFFLMLVMAMFYVGGRIVLIHYIRDTEQQVRGMGVPISERMRGDVSSVARAASQQARYGIEPMFSEAMDFYTGGYWTVYEKTPKAFSSTTNIAFGRLAFFVAICGIVFVLPLFWAQNRILLNPLTELIRAIREMGEHSADVDCPRLEWKGKDEFAQLAESVNRMIETIAAKTVSLASIEASHRALITGVPDALEIFDTQGRLVSITKLPEGVAEIPGLKVGELPSVAVFGEQAVAEFRRLLAETFRTGGIGKARFSVQTPVGQASVGATLNLEVRLSRLSEMFVLAVVRDVTAEVAEHKLRLAAEQRVLDGLKRESLTGLAAGIAHDMNNVLSVVLSAAEAHDADPSGDSVRTLGIIRDAVRKGSAMMRELQTFAGENKIRLSRASPKLVVEDVRPLASRVVGDNVILTISSDDRAPDVDIDLNQFWKVFFNIIKNAAEAIGTRPGHIALDAVPFDMTEEVASEFCSETALVPGPGVMFRISDDGSGVPPDMLARMFDPYVSSKSLGRGLGLAIVRTIVEAHGGGIRVTSELDEGTTFYVFLPASKLPAVVMPERDGSEPVDERRLDVLIVDNDEAILKTTSILLKTLKLSPHVARGRRDALAVVRRYAEGLRAIVLDANLGGIDTVRLLNAFRIGAPNVPIIVVSGSSPEEISEMFRAHPYDAFLAKPFTMNELKHAITRLVPRKLV